MGMKAKLPLHSPDPLPQGVGGIWSQSAPGNLPSRSWGTTYSEDLMCIIVVDPLKMTIPWDNAMMSQVLKHCCTQLLGPWKAQAYPLLPIPGVFLPLSSLSPFLLSLPYKSSRDHSCLFLY